MNNANETAAVKLEPFIPMDKKDIIRAAIYGAFAGAILTVLYILVGRVASAVMCRGDNDLCQNAPLYVAIFSVTLVSIGGLILLSQARICRPLFIVIASIAVLGDGGDDGNWRVDVCDVYLVGAIAVVHTLLGCIDCADCSGSVDYRWVAGAEPLFAVC